RLSNPFSPGFLVVIDLIGIIPPGWRRATLRPRFLSLEIFSAIRFPNDNMRLLTTQTDPTLAGVRVRRFRWGILAVLAALAFSSRAGELEAGFADPPNSARLRAYWWWLNGNVTKTAITRDQQ